MLTSSITRSYLMSFLLFFFMLPIYSNSYFTMANGTSLLERQCFMNLCYLLITKLCCFQWPDLKTFCHSVNVSLFPRQVSSNRTFFSARNLFLGYSEQNSLYMCYVLIIILFSFWIMQKFDNIWISYMYF